MPFFSFTSLHTENIRHPAGQVQQAGVLASISQDIPPHSALILHTQSQLGVDASVAESITAASDEVPQSASVSCSVIELPEQPITINAIKILFIIILDIK